MNASIFQGIEKAVEDFRNDPRHKCAYCDKRLTPKPAQFNFRDGKWQVTAYSWDPAQLKGWTRTEECVVPLEGGANSWVVCPDCRKRV